jgi:hypothetical protein
MIDSYFTKSIQCDIKALKLCITHLDKVEADPLYADVDNPTRGKCYYASVALLIYLGGAQSGYHLIRAITELGTHYWVETPRHSILDPTQEQFVIMRTPPPYSRGMRVSYRPNYTKHLPILNAMRQDSENQ